MNNNFHVAKEESEIMGRRTGEVFQIVREKGNIVEQLCRYAQDNGYSEEEAAHLVKNEVIPTVDEYNAVCREHADGEIEDWVQDRISERVEGMTLDEECKYKLGILEALRRTGKEILSRVCEESYEEMENEYEELSVDAVNRLEQGEYTIESLEQINRELAIAIENSGFEMTISDRFEELINGKADDDSVHGFVMELWQDEQYKYCAAVAACVARRNQELPSIPEDIPDRALVIGVCQGIDVANIETQASLGGITAEKAYKMLKMIAAVGVAMLVNAALFVTGLIVAGAIFVGTLHLLGDGLLVCLLGLSLGAMAFFILTEDISEIIDGAKNVTHKVCDFTYGKLKKGAAAVCDAVRKHVLPCLQEMLEGIHTFIGNLVIWFQRARNHERIRV